MAFGKVFGCVLMAVWLFAISDASEPQEEKPLKGPENSLSLVGTNAIFTCVSPFRSCVNLTWHKGHQLSFFWDIFIPINENYTDLRDRCIVENTTLGCKLTVTNVQLEDTGYVYCEIKIAGRSFESRIAELIVTNTQDNPLKGPYDSLSIVGTDAAFTCVSPLRNCRGLNWYKRYTPRTDRETIFSEENGIYFRDKYIVENSSTVGCKLIVTNVEMTDTGSIICEIKISGRPFEGRIAELIVIKTQEENPLKGPEDSLSFIGTNAIFICVSLLRSCVNMTWYKDLPIPIGLYFIPINDNYPHLRDRCIVENTTLGCKLTFTNVQLNDTGSVYCEIKIAGRSFESRTAELIVINAQNMGLVKGPENSSSVLGSDATFTCVSSSRDCDGMTWYKKIPGESTETIYHPENGVDLSNKYIVENSTVGCKLIVTNVRSIDAGFFICEKRIRINILIGTAYLTVIKPRREYPLKGPENSFSIVGSNATFTCVSPLRGCDRMSWHKYMLGRNPLTVFSDPKDIYLKGKYIVENAAEGCQLTVTNLETKDTGSVICQILDTTSRVDREGTAYLFVTNEIPEEGPLKGPENSFRLVGSNATFTCVSPSRDCGRMIWYKYPPEGFPETIYLAPYGIYRKDKYIVENSSVGCQLIVRNLEMNDTGSFKCGHLIGRKFFIGTAELFVINALYHSPLKGPKDSLRAVGSNATFACFSPSKDCGGMTWYKHKLGRDREIIFSEHDGIYGRDRYIVENFKGICILIVRNVEMADTGSIICEIVISRISFEGTAQLTVTRDVATSKPKRQRKLQLGEEMAAWDPLKEAISAMKEKDSFSCAGLTCQCCRDIRIPNNYFSMKYCLKVTYLPQTQRMIVGVEELPSRRSFNTEFRISNPITVCDYEFRPVICLKLYDLYVDKGTFTGCSKVTVKDKMPFKSVCFRINSPQPPMPRWNYKTPLSVIKTKPVKILHKKKENFNEID